MTQERYNALAFAEAIRAERNASTEMYETGSYPGPLDGFWYSQAEHVRSSAGEFVSPPSAMRLSAYFAGIRNVSEDLAKLPLMVYKDIGRGREKAKDHPLWRLLHDEPNAEMTSMAFRETMNHWALGWGNGYAEIERLGRGQPVALWPIHPGRVVPRRIEDVLFYDVWSSDTGKWVLFPAADIFHLHGLGGDGACGYSVFRFACDSIGRAIAVQKAAGALFRNGLNVSGVLEHPGKLGDKAMRNLRESMAENHASASNAYKPIILEEGMKYTKMSIPPEEAQMLETSEFTVEDIARWFRIPPHKLGHYKRAQGWSTLEATNTDYVIDTLMSWATRWEQEIARKLFAPADRAHYARHEFKGLMRGDSSARSAYYTARFNNGTLSVNDIRELEDENPIGPEGDVYFVPQNVRPIQQAIQEPEAPEPAKQPINAVDEPMSGDDSKPGGGTVDGPGADSNQAASHVIEPTALPVSLQAFEPLIEDAAERIVNAEMRELQKRADKADDDRERFSRWVHKFYEGHRAYVSKALAPVYRAWTNATGREVAPEPVSALIESRVKALTESAEAGGVIRLYAKTGLREMVEAIRKGLGYE